MQTTRRHTSPWRQTTVMTFRSPTSVLGASAPCPLPALRQTCARRCKPSAAQAQQLTHLCQHSTRGPIRCSARARAKQQQQAASRRVPAVQQDGVKPSVGALALCNAHGQQLLRHVKPRLCYDHAPQRQAVAAQHDRGGGGDWEQAISVDIVHRAQLSGAHLRAAMWPALLDS